MAADTIDLELPRPFGNVKFWKQIQLKLHLPYSLDYSSLFLSAVIFARLSGKPQNGMKASKSFLYHSLSFFRTLLVWDTP